VGSGYSGGSVRSGHPVRGQPRNFAPAGPPIRARLGWKERFRDLLLVALAFALGACALTAYTTFRIWQVGEQDGRRHVDAIVVLGAAQYNGVPTDVLRARLDHAIGLYREGLAPYLITTGGKLQGDRYTEAQTGFRYATSNGVPASAILMENTGSDTLESLQNVRAIFDAHGFHTALFVSDRSHMLRVLRMAQDQGIEGWASPADTSPDDTRAALIRDSMLHELGGLALYVFAQEGPDSTGGAPAAPSASPGGSPVAPSASPAAPSPAPSPPPGS
jgi:uncharacterized SAM-binding protein YcdF (DUF218 family)